MNKLAFVCACLTHAVFLLGFKVASIPIGNWSSRETLIWISDVNKAKINDTEEIKSTIPFSVLTFEDEPQLEDSKILSSYYLNDGSANKNHILFINNEADMANVLLTKQFSESKPGRKKWRVLGWEKFPQFLSNLGKELVESQNIDLPSKPLTLSIEIALPLGTLNPTVISSSGSDKFDRAAISRLRNIKISPAFSRMPGEIVWPSIKRTIINITLEEERI